MSSMRLAVSAPRVGIVDALDDRPWRRRAGGAAAARPGCARVMDRLDGKAVVGARQQRVLEAAAGQRLRRKLQPILPGRRRECGFAEQVFRTHSRPSSMPLTPSTLEHRAEKWEPVFRGSAATTDLQRIARSPFARAAAAPVAVRQCARPSPIASRAALPMVRCLPSRNRDGISSRQGRAGDRREAAGYRRRVAQWPTTRASSSEPAARPTTATRGPKNCF